MKSQMDIPVRIEGQDLRPGTLPAEDLAAVITALCQLMAAVGKQEKLPDLHLVSITDNCITLGLKTQRMRALRAYLTTLGILATSSLSLPHSCSAPTRVLNRFMEQHKASITLPYGRRNPVVVSNEQPFRVEEEATTRYGTTVYGVLESVGGADKVNAHLRVRGMPRVLTCSVSREQAQQLARRLFLVVGLQGVMQRSSEGLHQFQVTRVLSYDPDPARDPFADLKEHGIDRYFDGVDAMDFVRQVREG